MSDKEELIETLKDLTLTSKDNTRRIDELIIIFNIFSERLLRLEQQNLEF